MKLLASQNFKVCNVNLKLEIAKNDEERAKGLMNRSALAEGEGMLFVFPEERMLSFWMKNVPFDIDIGYFNKKGELINSLTMLGTSPMQQSEFPTYKSKKPALYAVEAVKGFFKKHSSKGPCKLDKAPGPSRE